MPRERKGANKYKDCDLYGPGVGAGGMKLHLESPPTRKRRTLEQANSSIPGLVPQPPMTGQVEMIVASKNIDNSFISRQNLHRRPLKHAMLHQPTRVIQPQMPTVPPVGISPSAMHSMPMAASWDKVYPPDQTMVFNPENPYAPITYPCGLCHTEVHDNDQGILCESGCNFWFHRTCAGLTEAAFHLIMLEVYAEWVCDRCLSSKSIPLVKFKP